jgi:hypothetical protein
MGEWMDNYNLNKKILCLVTGPGPSATCTTRYRQAISDTVQ